MPQPTDLFFLLVPSFRGLWQIGVLLKYAEVPIRFNDEINLPTRGPRQDLATSDFRHRQLPPSLPLGLYHSCTRRELKFWVYRRDHLVQG